MLCTSDYRPGAFKARESARLQCLTTTHLNNNTSIHQQQHKPQPSEEGQLQYNTFMQCDWLGSCLLGRPLACQSIHAQDYKPTSIEAPRKSARSTQPPSPQPAKIKAPWRSAPSNELRRPIRHSARPYINCKHPCTFGHVYISKINVLLLFSMDA